jgi:hypothetical protein
LNDTLIFDNNDFAININIVSYNINFPFNDPNNLTLDPGIIFSISKGIPGDPPSFKSNYITYNSENVYNVYLSLQINNLDNTKQNFTFASILNNDISCFLSGTQILTNSGYKNIENLNYSDLIYTVKDGYKKINKIGYNVIYNNPNNSDIGNKLYIYPKILNSEMTDDLILTGFHSILKLSLTKDEKMNVIDFMKHLYFTNNFYRMPICLIKNIIIYKSSGFYKVFHVSLENNDIYSNFGIYANGLLVESCSIRLMKK